MLAAAEKRTLEDSMSVPSKLNKLLLQYMTTERESVPARLIVCPDVSQSLISCAIHCLSFEMSPGTPMANIPVPVRCAQFLPLERKTH